MRKLFTHLLAVLLIFCFPAFLFANTPISHRQQTLQVGLYKLRPDFSSLNTAVANQYYFNTNPFYFDVTPKPITICSAASIVIQGDAETPTPNSFSWEVLQGATWINAPGVNNSADYPPVLLVNNTTSNILFSIRRKFTTAGVISYDSYYNVTVLPSSPIVNNTINTPVVNSFCSPGNPATITGSTPSGGDGNFTYQWQSSTDNVNFTNITGANANFYIPPVLTASTYYRRVVGAGSCVAISPSNTIGIVIIQPTSNNVITAPVTNSFCSASDPAAITGSVPAGGDGTYNYQWQVSTDNINFTNIAGATTKDYDPSTISVTTYYRRYTSSGICTVPVFSNVVTLAIMPVLSNNIISAPTVTTFCASGDATNISGNVPSGGNGTYNYQWQQSTDNLNFADITGANTKDFDPPLVNITTYYRRAVTSGPCTSPLLSGTVTVNIAPSPVTPVPVQPSVSICSGSKATLSVSSPVAGLVYNWYDSATKTNLLFTGADFTTPAQTANKLFYVESANGVCTSSSLASVQVTIAVPNPVLNNSLTAPAVNSFCIASDPLAITGSIPTGGDGVYTYQWQSSTDNINFSNITAATLKDYDPVLLPVTTYFRRVVTSGGCSTPVISNTITISILPSIANNIVTAPSVTAFCASGDPTIIVGGAVTGGNGTYAYQWQQSTDNVSFTDIPGATAKDFDPAIINTTTYYRRTVISGQCTAPVISNVIAINILPFPAIPVPVQTTVSICSGSTATLAISSPVAGLTYSWYDSPTKTTLLFTGITYTTSVQTANKIFYIESSNGSCTSAILSSVQVVIGTPNTIINNVLTPPAINSFCSPSDPATITGSIPTGGSGIYAYQWQQSTDNVNFTDISGATLIDYDPALIATTTYYRRITTSGGCSAPVFSNVSTISIFQTITSNTITAPTLASFCSSGDPTNIVGSTPNGGNATYTYQWQQSTDNVNFTNIAGATTKDFDPATINVTTYFRRVVTSGQCTTPVISNVVTVNILPFPALPVLTQTSVTTCSGTVVTLSVSTPLAGLTYNWYDSAAKTTLLFTGINYTTPAQTGNKTFYVESTNGTCTSPSTAQVQVIVTPPPVAPALVVSAVSTCSGTSATLSISGPQAGYIYNWYTSAAGGSVIYTGIDYTTPALSANAVYYVEAINTTGCNSITRATVAVTINAPPQVTAQGLSVCPGANATLTATSDAGSATINWYTTATGGSPVYTGGTFTTPPVIANTSYYVEAVNNATGCISTSRKLVQVGLLQQLAAPIVKADPSTINTVTFSWAAVSNATGYKVSIDNGVTFTDPSSGTNGLTHTISGLLQNQSVTIIVKATGTTICQLSDGSTAITAKADSPTEDIYVANAFTPNYDGRNDAVYVHSEGIKTLSFAVYSQWGEMVFNSTNIANGWDGTYKGAKEPAGVYIYYVKALMNNGHEVNKKGTITLLR